ncbi:D-aminoacyl-tRNA deacylase [Pygmaiobacter massiliensis]|uniref:D-aminoacyl-tRNA deacylase n=1 Tax=Pygmaiobacter massiliensis TaxID=1917873 RepID=UPI000C7B6FEA|nr:D-aminoacyl-tRNA deacylase [Pygmaiobacter massiliensis]
MKAVLQRVKNASVTINGAETHTIGEGLLILLGVAATDTLDDAKLLARKCAELRIFEDENEKLNLSALDLGYDIMIVSNFTLQADTKKGRRPSFIAAAKPPLSVEAYELFIQCVREAGISKVETGEFGAEMQIALVNDGPVTLVLDTEEWKRS